MIECGSNHHGMSAQPVNVRGQRTRQEHAALQGTAAQLQRCTGRTKCSAALIVTGASRRSAVPGALVPA
jgi:hypothetical protein